MSELIEKLLQRGQFTLELIHQTENWQQLNWQLLEEKLLQALQYIAAQHFQQKPWPNFELSLICTNDQEIQSLNHQYRGKDQTTNVLSFPANKYQPGSYAEFSRVEYVHLGDVIIAYETLVKEAKIYQFTQEEYFMHLFVHSVFHLLGFEHEQAAAAKAMAAFEHKVLLYLGFKSPYNLTDF